MESRWLTLADAGTVQLEAQTPQQSVATVLAFLDERGVRLDGDR